MTNRKRTRREFLATGATSAALVNSIQPAQAAVFTPEERATLFALEADSKGDLRCPVDCVEFVYEL